MVLFGGCDNRVVKDTWELYEGAPASYRVRRARPRSPQLVPATGSLPWLGETLTLELSRAPAGASWAAGLLGFGLRRHASRVDVTPQLVTDVTLLELIPLADGAGSWSLELPPDPSLMGSTFHVQGAVPEPGRGS